MTPATARLALTGTPRFERDGLTIVADRLGRRERLALAALAVQRGPIPHETLAHVIWDGQPPPTWPAALRGIVSDARAFLAAAGLDGGRALVSKAGCYELRLPGAVALDVEVEPLLRAARAALAGGDHVAAARLAAQVRTVAQAPFLPGSEGAWETGIRRRLHDHLAEALRLSGEAALVAGDAPAALTAAEAAVARDSFDEHAHQLVMRAHALGGNRAAALLAYARCRDLLADELGTDPAPETEAIYLDILRQGLPGASAGAARFVPPKTEFVRYGRERIAYQVLDGAAGGQTGRSKRGGRVTLLVTGGSFSNVDTIWQHPASADFFRCLSAVGRVILFDRWGAWDNGTPDPRSGGEAMLDSWLRAIEHVLAATGSPRAAILASLDGGPPAIRFAARFPERVCALVLVNTTARWLAADDYPAGVAGAEARRTVAWAKEYWGTEAFAAAMYPAAADDIEFLRWYAANQRALAQPEVAAARLLALCGVDVRGALGAIRAPTLVVHRRSHLAFPVTQGHYLARHIAGARFVELPGTGGMFGPDSQDLARTVLAFLEETEGSPPEAVQRPADPAARPLR